MKTKNRSRPMPATKPRYSMSEFARRGELIYKRSIAKHMKPAQKGQFVVIDIESGNYEVGEDEIEISDRLFARVPDAQIWLRRVGSPYARKFGRGRPVAK